MSCFEHSPLIDASSGTIVCSECAHVLEEGLSYQEVKLPQPFSLKELQQFTPDVEKPELIHGESAYELLQKLETDSTCVNQQLKMPLQSSRRPKN